MKVVIVELTDLTSVFDGGARAVVDLCAIAQADGHDVELLGLDRLRSSGDLSGFMQGLDHDEVVIVASRPEVGLALSAFLPVNAIRLFLGHDLHHLRMQRWLEVGGAEAPVLRDIELMRRIEQRCWRAYDLSLYPDVIEADAVNEALDLHAGDPPRALPFQYFVAPFAPATGRLRSDDGSRRNLVFIGGPNHTPNRDGVLFFAREIWPEVHGATPGLRFRVIGSWSGAAARELAGISGVELLGPIDDEQIRAVCGSGDIGLAPLRFGAGVKRKVLHYLQLGLDVVSTPVGLQGLPEPWPEPNLVAADLEEWPRVLTKTLSLSVCGSERANLYLREHFSSTSALRQWRAMIDRASQNRQLRLAITT